MDLKPFWDESLSIIQKDLDIKEFEFWFSQIHYLGCTGMLIKLGVPSKFYMEQVKAKYGSLIENTLKQLAGHNINTELVVPDEGLPEVEDQHEEIQEKAKTPSPSSTSGNSGRSKTTTNTPVREKAKKKHGQLNEKYTFENFVMGENDFAYNAAVAISREPGKDYNPLLIYGGVGMGKTHLMQAVGNRLHQEEENLKITYVPSETFIHEFVESLKSKTMNAFKNKYRNVDILLIDDIHDLTNKHETQEELFHTFNALYDNKKQMIFTCDRPPSELQKFNDRLRSRFQRGLVVDLQLPSLESRLAILKKKSQSQGVIISDAVLEFTARTITSNVRDLEAALIAIIGYAKLVNQTVTVDMAKNLLKNNFSSSIHQNISIDLVQRIVADYFQIGTSDLKGKKRTQTVTLPRQIAMYIIRELTEYSTTEIGLEFGGRDHTTVMHAVQKIEERMKKDGSLDTKLQGLIRSVKESQGKG
jgi:chromosomal replication initiator protein